MDSEDSEESEMKGGLARYIPKFERDLVWRNILAFLYLHTAALYGIYLSVFHAKIATTLFSKLFLRQIPFFFNFHDLPCFKKIISVINIQF